MQKNYEDLELEKLAYELYKIDWVNTHVSPEFQLATYREYALEMRENYDEDYTFDDFLFDRGYGDSIYVCFDEFLGAEYQDMDYMKHLLGNSVFFKEYCRSMDSSLEQEQETTGLDSVISAAAKRSVDEESISQREGGFSR